MAHAGNRSSLATGLVASFLGLSACQSTLPGEERSLADVNREQRQEFFRACYIQTVKRHQDHYIYVDRAQVHRVCSNMARARVPR